MEISRFSVKPASIQVAEFLRDAIERKVFVSEVPGIHQLAADLGVNHKTVTKALEILEDQGVLESAGRGRRRRIMKATPKMGVSLRIGILCIESADSSIDPVIDIQRLLTKSGHTPFFADKTLTDLKMDVRRIHEFVKSSEADAWIVLAASREVLEWFASQSVPAFALFGRRQGVNIAGAGPLTRPALVGIMEKLFLLGHRRIVMLSREMRRVPEPSEFEQTFLNCLRDHGIEVGSYHLPAWEEGRDGFQSLLKSLFKVSPPSALIVHEPHQLVAILQFVAGRGIRVPEDVSLACLDFDHSFRWCKPAIAHISWDVRKAAGCVEKWANEISRGVDDRKQTGIKAVFAEGGTIGRR